MKLQLLSGFYGGKVTKTIWAGHLTAVSGIQHSYLVRPTKHQFTKFTADYGRLKCGRTTKKGIQRLLLKFWNIEPYGI
ncbi:MAG: hypothetical protein AAF717_01220 [Bacteroidota bacterium]